MAEPRGESFYGGRFFENKYDHNNLSDDAWNYEVGFQGPIRWGEGNEPAAYVKSRYEPDQYMDYDDDDRDRNWDVADIRTGQKQLFEPVPETHEIDYAFATKDARHQIPTLLGMAAQHSLERTGRLPRASNDLSVYSNRLVNKFADLGVIETPAQRGKEQPLNSLNWNTGAEDALWKTRELRSYGNEVPFDRVDQGRQFTRALLRRPKPSQGEQLTIT